MIVPKYKFDFDSVESIKNATSDEIVRYSSELLTWLQDMNWPIAYPITDILIDFVNELETEIIEILDGQDLNWKINIVINLLYYSTFGISESLKSKLAGILDDENDFEELKIEVRDVLNKWSE